MLQNNIKYGGKVHYDIHPPNLPKGKWYAFYLETYDVKKILNEQLKGK